MLGVSQGMLWNHLYGWGSEGRNLKTHQRIQMEREFFLFNYYSLLSLVKGLHRFRNPNPPFRVKEAHPWFGILEEKLDKTQEEVLAHLYTGVFDERLETVVQFQCMGKYIFLPL